MSVAPHDPTVESVADRRDRGSIDASLEILFGGVAIIMFMLLIVEVGAYWHTRNLLEASAAEGARMAAAFDGTCATGTGRARQVLSANTSWADEVNFSCSESNGIVTLTASATTPSVLGFVAGFTVNVTESAPRER